MSTGRWQDIGLGQCRGGEGLSPMEQSSLAMVEVNDGDSGAGQRGKGLVL